MSYPFKWNPLSEDLEAKRHQIFEEGSLRLGNVKCVPLGFSGPADMPKVAEQIYNMEVRPDDIWIMTYPKCGTTMTQVYSNLKPPYSINVSTSKNQH